MHEVEPLETGQANANRRGCGSLSRTRIEAGSRFGMQTEKLTISSTRFESRDSVAFRPELCRMCNPEVIFITSAKRKLSTAIQASGPVEGAIRMLTCQRLPRDAAPVRRHRGAGKISSLSFPA